MKFFIKIMLMAILLMGINGCSSSDDSTPTTTAPAGGTSGGTGDTLPEGVSESGTFVVTMDGITSTLHTYKTEILNLGESNTAQFDKVTGNESVGFFVSAQSLYNGSTDSILVITFRFPNEGAITTGMTSSGYSSVFSFSINGTTYLNWHGERAEPYNINLTTVEYDGSNMHLVGSIDLNLYDGRDDTAEIVHVSFDVTPILVQH